MTATRVLRARQGVKAGSGQRASIPLFQVHMPASALAPLRETLMSGYIGQGPRVEEFERALQPWLGSAQVLTVNSGTSALHLALRLAGVGRDDEVVSTPMTCTATNVPILERGGRIVWADIDPRTGNIDPHDVERQITTRTKAIVAVHWGGYPCELDVLCAIARRHQVALIEDAAHAFGATYRRRPIGSHGEFVCFSFQAIKHLTTVDGGALVCRSAEAYRRGKLLRWYGIDREVAAKDFRCDVDVPEYGYKFHMHDVCATIGLDQLRHVGRVLARHRENAAFYTRALSGLAGVRLLDYQADRQSAFWLFTILVNDRADFMRAMKAAGITVSQVHGRNDHLTMMQPFRRDLPGVDAFMEQQVSIPVGWWVSDEERAYIAKTIRRLRG